MGMEKQLERTMCPTLSVQPHAEIMELISLFDGASTVVETVAKKLGCSPKAILLAENDAGYKEACLCRIWLPN